MAVGGKRDAFGHVRARRKSAETGVGGVGEHKARSTSFRQADEAAGQLIRQGGQRALQ